MTLCREYCQAVIAPCRIIVDAGMSAGGAMSRTMVGLLAAAGAVMAALVGGNDGWVEAVLIAFAGTATGLAAYLALPPSKKRLTQLLIFASIRS
jgi:poly(3-hydroxybutyrate) depolymerase